MQREVQVPSALIVALNGLIVLFVVGSAHYVQRQRDRRMAAQTSRQLQQSDESPPGAVASSTRQEGV
jgi:ABC-type uncharacterized transport system permease subunit